MPCRVRSLALKSPVKAACMTSDCEQTTALCTGNVAPLQIMVRSESSVSPRILGLSGTAIWFPKIYLAYFVRTSKAHRPLVEDGLGSTVCCDISRAPGIGVTLGP
jgi:hypothetical protein